MNEFVDVNQLVIVDPDYIIIRVEWDRKLILPIKSGYDFMRIWGSAVEVEQRGSDPPKLRKPTGFKDISFMTEKEFKMLKLSTVIDPPLEDS